MMNQNSTISFKEIDFNPFEDTNEIEKTILINESQREIWLSCVIGGDPANLAYNESVSLDLRGPLNIDYFKKALEKVVQRHEALKSSISGNGDYLIVYKEVSFNVPIEDLTASNEDEQKQTLHDLLQHEMVTPFKLESAPLFRFYIHKLDHDHYYFTLIVHHIIVDGWSIGIILEDLSKFYNGLIKGIPLALTTPSQISDYAQNQYAFSKSEQFDKTEKFWLDIYKDHVPVLDLPTDFKRSAPRTYNANRIDQILPLELVTRIKLTGAKVGCSFVNTLLSAFEIFLSSKTGQEDIVVGLPTAGQSAVEMLDLVCHCVNLLPLKSTVNQSNSFHDYLKIRKTAFFDAYDHQQLSFGQLIKKLNLKRDPARIPLVPIMFNIDMGMDSEVSFHQLDHCLISNPRAYETFEIFLNATESHGTFILEWTYNTQLFKFSTIKLMMDDFESLLQSLTSHPEQKLIDFFPKGNNGPKETNTIPKILFSHTYRNIIQMIDDTANLYPDKAAAHFRNHSMTYKTLLEKSDQLASFLIKKGIKTGDIIGLAADRSLEMLVSLIAILKSGAIYVPLDPEYPHERVEFMLNDSSAKLLLISQAYQNRYQSNAEEIVLQEIWPLLKEYEIIEPEKKINLNDIAYILYTSGSTGKPKGVKISHRNLANFLTSMQNSPGIHANDRLLAITTISFDIAGLELYLPLISGAEIFIADHDEVKDGRLLLSLMQEKKISIMQATPSTWQMIIDSGWENKLDIKILSGGEAISKQLANQLLKRSMELWNMYGPTETTIWSTIKQVSAEDEIPTIGFPIAHTQIYIMDEQGQPAPAGTAGEIYIGGMGVAEGYLNRPELTDEKFVSDPYAENNSSKLYRTGDLGKLLATGEFLCLGRIDQQIKIRGHRIELGEIEAAISSLSEIKQSVVLARETSTTDKQLIAYILLNDQQVKEDGLSWKERWDTLYTIGAEAKKGLAVTEQNLDDTLLEHYQNKSDLALQSSEWLKASVERIKALHAKRIYEIGSGAGQLLFELASETDYYVATDYADTAIVKLNEKIHAFPEKWGHVKAKTTPADDFTFVSGMDFDLILIHSVAQYFPNSDYLIDVIKKSSASIYTSGCIFIGDMQGKNSLEMCHATDHLPHSADQATVEEFKEIVLNRTRIEDEFVADPAFFYNLPKLIPEITGVEVQLRKGQLLNETTKYHYDVWLYIGESPEQKSAELSLDWSSRPTLSEIQKTLSENRSSVIQIKNILNARTAKDLRLIQLINTDEKYTSIGEIKNELKKAPEGIDPNVFWAMADEVNFNAHIKWSTDGTDGLFEVIFIPLSFKDAIPENPYAKKLIASDIRDFAKTPFSKNEILLSKERIEGWKQTVRTILPLYMVPEDFIALKSFPLTPNGKIDRNALPKKNTKKIAKSGAQALPVTKGERLVANIWSTILELDDINVNDDFFELGGHSILAVKVMVAIEKETGTRLSIAALFENSTIEKLAKLITDEKENKLEPPQSDKTSLPLFTHLNQLEVPTTEPQKEIWLACELGGMDANRAYNLSFSQHFYGDFNVDAMQKAIQELVNRHQSLRSTISRDGTLMIIPSHKVALCPVEDISQLAVDEQQLFMDHLSTENANMVFDLSNGPLFKSTLLKVSNQHYYLTVTVHHIIFDGWSFDIAQKELSQLYSSYASGKPSDLAPAPLFSSYAWSSQAFYQSDDYIRTENYWLDHLKGNLPPLELPIDFVRPKVRSYQSTRIVFNLDQKAYIGLKRMGTKANCSLAISLRAALEIFIYRITGQEQMVTGLPIAGQLIGDENLIGHCANVLPLRTVIDHNMDFSSYLIKRKREILEAYDYPELTYGSLLKKLNLGREQSYLPLLSVVMNTDHWLDNETSFYGLTTKFEANTKTYENFELALDFTDYGDHMTLRWDYNKALFKPETIFRLQQQLEYMMIYISEFDKVAVNKIPLASEQVLIDQLNSWNDNAFLYDKQKTIQELITDAVYRFPEHIAVSFQNVNFSYLTLEQKSNQLANLLISKGMKKGSRIGVALDRSANMIVVLLAIMKSGAVYLPFDTNHPKDRIAYMLEDAEAQMLITAKKYSNHYTDKISEIYLEDAFEELESYSSEKPVVNISGDDMVYILYTSGSTGKPKGVQIRHRNVVNFLLGMQQMPGIDENDSVLAITPISFDMAVLLYLPLTCGAKLVVADLETSKDGRLIHDIINEKHISWMIATPSTWKMTIASGWKDKKSILAISAGENLPKDLAKSLLEHCTSVWNGYGPTETTVMVLMKEILNIEDPITLGKPIINTQIYILDKFNQRTPIGLPGEIYIAGDGVAAGYQNLPELTSNSFVPDPFSSIPGSIMYRTGDLGKFLQNGDVMYLGRIDQQIKIRGHRIELGEIEQTLVNHENISAAVVSTIENSQEDLFLVAYIIPKKISSDKDQIANWEKYLKDNLPDYMIPHDYVIVDSFPLTENGKIDRKNLPRPERMTTAYLDQIYQAPRNQTEKMISKIWEMNLGLEKVGVTSDFFKSGGHSIIAVKIMLTIEQETGKRLPLSALFENPTIEKLAKLIDGDETNISWDSLVKIKPEGTKIPIYMVHGGGLNVLTFNALATYMDKDQPIYGIQAIGLNGRSKLYYTMEEIAAKYLEEVINNNPDGPYAIAGYSLGGLIAYEMVKQLKAMGKEIYFLGILDTSALGRDANDSAFIKTARKLIRQFKKLAFFSRQFMKNPKSTINYQAKVLSYKIKSVFKTEYSPDEEYFTYEDDINKSYDIAYNNYVMTPLDIEVNLFKVEERVYYLDDPMYLGWNRYAKKGVKIHDIPGDHKTFLFPPNDKRFAEVLQQALNEQK